MALRKGQAVSETQHHQRSGRHVCDQTRCMQDCGDKRSVRERNSGARIKGVTMAFSLA
jgi:hypothetical protein